MLLKPIYFTYCSLIKKLLEIIKFMIAVDLTRDTRRINHQPYY